VSTSSQAFMASVHPLLDGEVLLENIEFEHSESGETVQMPSLTITPSLPNDGLTTSELRTTTRRTMVSRRRSDLLRTSVAQQ
jgi:hypothetical protein